MEKVDEEELEMGMETGLGRDWDGKEMRTGMGLEKGMGRRMELGMGTGKELGWRQLGWG